MTAPFDPLARLQLSPAAQRLLRIVRNNAAGIIAEKLRTQLWGDYPPTDPKMLFVFLAELNKQLQSYGFMVRSEAGIYQLRRARS